MGRGQRAALLRVPVPFPAHPLPVLLRELSSQDLALVFRFYLWEVWGEMSEMSDYFDNGG